MSRQHLFKKYGIVKFIILATSIYFLLFLYLLISVLFYADLKNAISFWRWYLVFEL